MPSVTIDAGVLAAPPLHGTTGDDAHRYIETLLDWSKLLDEPWVAIYMSERASETLFAEGLYPLREQLRRLFGATGIIEYDVNTVAMVVDRLLQLTPSFETYFSISDVLAENLVTEPDILGLCAGAGLQSELGRCLILIAILRRHCQGQISDHSLILRDAPDRIVRVTALIHDLEHHRADLAALPVPPEVFSGDVLICDSFRGLIECLDGVGLLLRASDDFGIGTAIRIALYKSQLTAGKVPDWDADLLYKIGGTFRATLQSLHPTYQLADRLLRAIVETLEQANLIDTHPLRTGRGGADPQRTRESDNASAWRRDIDRDHHLHYWVCPNGEVEIASINYPHDDFEIPE